MHTSRSAVLAVTPGTCSQRCEQLHEGGARHDVGWEGHTCSSPRWWQGKRSEGKDACRVQVLTFIFG